MANKICSVEGCNGPHKAKGLCGKHYKRARVKGDLPDSKKCTVKGRNKFAYAKDLCVGHNTRLIRFGDVQEEIPLGRVPKKCTVEGCNRPHSARGLCEMHYSREKRKGFPKLKKCTVLSCNRMRKYKKLCDYHYRVGREKSCLADDCFSLARKKGLCRQHYSMEVKAGNIKGKMCDVPNCPNATVGDTYCSAHKSRLARTGDVQAHIPIRVRVEKKPLGKQVYHMEDWELDLDKEISKERKALVFGADPAYKEESPAPIYKVYAGSGTSVLDY